MRRSSSWANPRRLVIHSVTAISFAAHLEQSLSARGYRVLNAGEPGWSSGMLVPAARRIVDYFKPQILILWMGNNEWINWLPTERTPNPWVLSMFRSLAGSRAVAYAEYLLLRWLVNRAHSRLSEFDEDYELTGFDHAIKHPLSQQISDWADVKQTFLANFETNLLRIIQYAKAKEVRVVLMTVPFSYRLSPAWKHPQPLAFAPANRPFVESTVKEWLAAYRSKDYALALEKLEPALAREPSAALLHYLKAATLEAQGKPAAAEASYALCREKDGGIPGSMLSINQTIRKVAASTSTELVDLQIVFDQYQHGVNRYFNEDLILDDCHPTPLGHRLIAQCLLPLVAAPATAPAPGR